MMLLRRQVKGCHTILHKTFIALNLFFNPFNAVVPLWGTFMNFVINTFSKKILIL